MRIRKSKNNQRTFFFSAFFNGVKVIWIQFNELPCDPH